MEKQDYRPLGVGDLVRVLRACRLPDIEESLGVSQIERIDRSADGTCLYWVRGFLCARTERQLRRTRTMSEIWAEDDEREERSQ